MEWQTILPGIRRKGASFTINTVLVTAWLRKTIKDRTVTKIDLLCAVRSAFELCYGEEYFESLPEWLHREMATHHN